MSGFAGTGCRERVRRIRLRISCAAACSVTGLLLTPYPPDQQRTKAVWLLLTLLLYARVLSGVRLAYAIVSMLAAYSATIGVVAVVRDAGAGYHSVVSTLVVLFAATEALLLWSRRVAGSVGDLRPSDDRDALTAGDGSPILDMAR